MDGWGRSELGRGGQEMQSRGALGVDKETAPTPTPVLPDCTVCISTDEGTVGMFHRPVTRHSEVEGHVPNPWQVLGE